MDAASLEKKIRAILAANLKKCGLVLRVKNTESLINSNIIDSLGALEFVSQLEKIFRIKISPEEMTELNFDSIVKIAEFIKRKMQI